MRRLMNGFGLAIFLVGLIALGNVLVSRHSDLVTKVQAKEFHNGDVDFDKSCSVRSLKGAYGFYRTGTTAAGPLAAVGQIIYDGRGNFSDRETIRKNGVTTNDLFADAPDTGTYQVDPDCTGRAFLPDGTEFVHLVVTDGGRGAFIMSLSNGNTVYGVLRRVGPDQ